jgi:hypothetical protein
MRIHGEREQRYAQRKRQTMMDTYFLLIERQAATPEERGLILNALFRPAPSHGLDGVEPPNFTEFLGKSGGVKIE